MTSESALEQTELTPGRVLTELRTRGWTLKTCAAVLGLFGGIIAPLVGSVLTAIAWFIGDWHGFHLQRLGTVLLFMTIPLLLFGAHCLDLSDKEIKGASAPQSSVEKTDRSIEEEGNINDLERN